MRRLPCLPLTGPATARLIRGLSTHSDSLSQANRATQNTLSPDTVLTCHSGRRYLIERVLQKKENSPLGVYLAKYAFLNQFLSSIA